MQQPHAPSYRPPRVLQVGILTQTLIVHLIRTQRLPFFQEVAAWPVVLATLLISGAAGAAQRGAWSRAGHGCRPARSACMRHAVHLPSLPCPTPRACCACPAPTPAAIGLALPYTPVGALERMAPLPPSFYGWVAATVLGGWVGLQACPTACYRRSCMQCLPMLPECRLPSCCCCCGAGYAVTLQLAKMLFIRSFGHWLP